MPGSRLRKQADHGPFSYIEKSGVAEAYYRWQLGEAFGLTADIQYQHNDYKSGQGPKGWIYGLRGALGF